MRMKILNKNINRKGELTTKQLVTIIILIVSFVIILFLIFRLNLGETTDKEICHNSVVLKSKTVGISEPLDCKTNYLCISGGEDCKEIPTTTKVKVDPENKEEVMKAIAEEMADCWYMFGEGEINYGEKGGLSIKYALCSSIEFDDKVQEEFSTIAYSEFYDYLEKTKKDSSESYLKYLYDVADVGALKTQSTIKVNILQDEIKTNERYSIITGIDDNFFESDKFLKVYIIPTLETSSRLEQGEFITKA